MTPFDSKYLARALMAVAASATVVASSPAAAQMDHDDPDHHAKEVMSVLDFREVGPTIMSGRVSDLAVDESNPSTFYVGTATGGLWKTTSGGVEFEPVFTDQATSSIGDVTLAPSSPNVVWVGTGEPQNRQSSPWGNGVYRSLDGGATWDHLGLEDTHHISRIQVHPLDPDVAYVAAMGHLWGPNETRGVFKTTDGGQTWEKVLYVDEHTGAIDLVMDPNHPNTLFAAMYQRQRRAWGFNGGGPGSGIYRSMDGGQSWTELTSGLPEGDKGRIGLDIYRGDSNLIYAVVEADARAPGVPTQGERQNGVYRSWDRGDTWEKTSDTNNRPMYYSHIRVDPNNPQLVFMGGANGYRSTDGGYTFTDDAADGVHLDHHAWWINPDDSDHQILGSDGGVSVTWDGSDSWIQYRNLPISQFYEIGVDNQTPYHVCGGLQDNGSWCAPSDTWSNQGIRTRDWYNVGGGDGFFTAMHPTDPRVMFAESQGGNIAIVDRLGQERRGIRPAAVDEAGESLPERRNWNSPIVISAHDPDRVYFGSNYLHRSDDLGHSWTRISDDNTFAIDRETLEIMGVMGSEAQISLNDGQSNYGNLTAIAESPLDADLLYTGSDDGRLMRTRDGGATWDDITSNVPGLPANTYVTRIVAANHSTEAVVAAFDGHRSDDYAAYIYRSLDAGDSWELIVEGLPANSISALAQHPTSPNLWFTGNELGVYASVDGGDRWVAMTGLGLPTVPVDDIKIQERENDLVLGTHGRGIWIMDDIGPLSDLAMGDPAEEIGVKVFSMGPAVSYNTYRPQGWTPGIFEADNGPYGVQVRYHVPGTLPEGWGDVTLEVRDASGAVVRTLNGSSSGGMHEVTWDLRLAMTDDDGDQTVAGPRVAPGTYTVALSFEGGESDSAPVQVQVDPRSQLSAAQLGERHAAMMDSYRMTPSYQSALQNVGRANDQIEGAIERIDEAGMGDSDLADRLDGAMDRLSEIEEALREAGRGAGAWGQIQGMHRMPSASQLQAIDDSWASLPGAIRDLNTFIEGDLPALMREAYAVAAPEPDTLSPSPLPSRGGGQ